ncbi:unnamed protein product [Somion occarium]|uniref:Uncharacterized protein n=1 Tax=Somion occarium TaxID=3059160 RepID=A0ABP1DNK9_9APHY
MRQFHDHQGFASSPRALEVYHPAYILAVNHLALPGPAFSFFLSSLPLLFLTSTIPRIAHIIAASAAVIGGTFFTPLLAPAVVSVVGFSPAGPVAGSLAAAAQAGMGNVVAGSSFAIVQSIGMGGAVPIIGQVVGGAIVGSAAYIAAVVRG